MSTRLHNSCDAPPAEYFVRTRKQVRQAASQAPPSIYLIVYPHHLIRASLKPSLRTSDYSLSSRGAPLIILSHLTLIVTSTKDKAFITTFSASLQLCARNNSCHVISIVPESRTNHFYSLRELLGPRFS